MAQQFGYGGRVPFWIDVARGVIDGTWDVVSKFGANPSVGTTQEDIWDGGGAYTGFLQAADTMVVAAGGDVADDDDGGAGARTITIQGLDSNWDAAEETITLAGADESAPTATSFIRVFRAWVASVGTYGVANTGDITIATDTAGTVVAKILAGQGQTNMAIYTVPDGSAALVIHVSASIDTTKSGDFEWVQRQNADDIAAPMPGVRIFHTISGLAGPFEHDFRAYTVFAARTDIWARATTANAAGDPVQSDMAILLVPAATMA
jgi:hypothetical protein